MRVAPRYRRYSHVARKPGMTASMPSSRRMKLENYRATIVRLVASAFSFVSSFEGYQSATSV